MILPDRKVLMGMALGAVCGMGIAAIGPGIVMSALADEPKTGIDTAGLVKFEGRDYDVQYDAGVDTTPAGKSRVKKIEFGRVSYVDITRTSTGTYSTDAMFSNHVQYPGISVEEQPSAGVVISELTGFGNWVALPLVRGSSFVHIRGGNHSTISGGGVTCFFGRYSTSC